MMTKTQLPASETGSEAERYLFRVRQEGDLLPNVFVAAKDRQIKRQRLATPQSLNYEDTGLDIYSIHKLTATFVEIPRENSIAKLWESAHEALSQRDVEPGQSTKEQWKAYIKGNQPQVLEHNDLFAALKALLRLELNSHVAFWAWCILLQIPKILTGDETALLRQVAKIESSELALLAFRGVLVEVFRQTDLKNI